jgi:serine/threonine-protein kinase RsbW
VLHLEPACLADRPSLSTAALPMAHAHHKPAPDLDQGTLSVPNEQRAMDEAQNHVIALAEKRGFPKASLFAVRLALHEAIMNAFRHGHKGLAPTVPVHVKFQVSDQHIDLTVEDQGPGFDPQDVPDPTLEENLERGSGRGLLLIRAYMSIVEYNAKGNALRMVYDKPGS